MDRSERLEAATRRYRLAGGALVVLGAAAGTPLLPALGLLIALAAGPLAAQAGSRSSR